MARNLKQLNVPVTESSALEYLETNPDEANFHSGCIIIKVLQNKFI